MADSNVVPLGLDGEEKHTDVTFDVVSPVTGQVLYKSAAASVDDAQAAIASAAEAYKTWSNTKVHERRDILRRLAGVLSKREDELFKMDNVETGAVDSYFEFIFNDAVQTSKDAASLISSVRGSIPNVSEEGRSV